MDYAQISKETISYLHKSYASLKNSPLDPVIRVLVEHRVSQINGCAYCISLHRNEAKQLKIAPEKIEALKEWKNSDVFSEKEKLAFQWGEELTSLQIIEETKASLTNHFSERELVDLTACASIMNALNRIAIALRDLP